MYTAESIASRKVSLNKMIPYIWVVTSTIPIILIYLIYYQFLNDQNLPTFLLGVIVSFLILIVLQELIVSKYIKMFPYWTFSLTLGIALGLLWSLLFIGSLFVIVVQSGALALNLKPYIGSSASAVLTIIVIPTSVSLVFLIFTYIIWYRVVKPLHKSSKLSEKNKILFEAIVAIVVSVFSSLSIYVALFIISLSNSLLAFIISSLVFSYMTFAGFKEVYSENIFFNVFKFKDGSEL